MTHEHDKQREAVASAYTDALERSTSKGGCCGGGGPTLPAGYEQELERHAEAGSSSFGCGNPLAFAGVDAGQTVLDLGSGAGLDLLIAAEKVGPEGRVIGVDMTDAMIEAARTNVAKAGLANVEVRKGIIEDLPVEDASVDWVISNCVINLAPDKAPVFREIARVLKPGGRISISDIVVKDLPETLRASMEAYVACVGGAISEQEYADGLAEAGLEGVEVTDRVVYDKEQLLEILKSDFGCCGTTTAHVSPALDEVEGRVWSARFVGRRL